MVGQASVVFFAAIEKFIVSLSSLLLLLFITTMLRTALTGAIARSRVAVTPMARRAPMGKTRILLNNTVC